jgi:hypothetical protein
VPKIHFKPIHKPELPRELPQKPKVSRHFKIAMMFEVDGGISFAVRETLKRLSRKSFGAGISFASAVFIIWDTENNLKCTYVFAGVGLGAGLSFKQIGGRGATLWGEWTPFVTEKPISCAQFGRTMRLTTIGSADWSQTWVLIETPPGVRDVYIDIDTGFTVGASMATYPAHTSAFVPLESPKPFNGH